jgi:2-isopropylmalate synthase
MGIEVLPAGNLAKLTETAHFVDELLNRAPNPAQPYVGKNAFAHKAGMHAAGVSADSSTFEHVEPGSVGNRSDVIVSELAGRATIADKGNSAGLGLDDATSARIVERVKELEHRGYQFEAADGSFELLMRRESGQYEPLFRLESWRVTVEQQADGDVLSEATIAISMGDERYERTATGNGPVNALDSALRSAVTEVYPDVGKVELVNYKVRILDESHGTDAVTRVLIDASDGETVWGTIGVGENVIAASWQALVDSLEYGQQAGRRKGDG